MLALDALDERFEIDAHRFGLLVCLRRRGRFCARACALAAHLRCSSARRSSSLGGASSERDVIVEILRHRLTHVLRRRTLALPLLRAIPVVALLLRRARATAEHLHLARDDLGRVPVLAVLVLPLARAQRSLDVDLRAFAQVLARDLAELVEQHDRVPLGALLLIASLAILPLLARREANVRDRFA